MIGKLPREDGTNHFEVFFMSGVWLILLLFAATGERSDPEALTALLIQARRDLHYSYPSISLEFPVSEFDDAIHAAGFKPLRTLIWMQATS